MPTRRRHDRLRRGDDRGDVKELFGQRQGARTSDRIADLGTWRASLVTWKDGGQNCSRADGRVRAMRQAISPRLAISTLRMGTGSGPLEAEDAEGGGLGQ